MFRNREDGARRLAQELKTRKLYHPLVLAIPRGGVVTGAVLAEILGAELDVVLSRKLRAPGNPELALGAVCEDGQVYLTADACAAYGLTPDDLADERRRQLEEIERRKQLFRAVRPKATIRGRSVIVTDDGIATGSTMLAALHTVKAEQPRELIVAVPVAPPDRLAEIRRWCDEVICLLSPATFWAVGQFYEDFSAVEDAKVVQILRATAPKAKSRSLAKD